MSSARMSLQREAPYGTAVAVPALEGPSTKMRLVLAARWRIGMARKSSGEAGLLHAVELHDDDGSGLEHTLQHLYLPRVFKPAPR
jgi:hypothetical protein